MRGARTATRTILIVEDDPEVREICAQVLTDEGYAVHAAPDGVSGIAQLDRMPDVIVLDLVMPRMDGWEFMRRLRAVAGPRTHAGAVTHRDVEFRRRARWRASDPAQALRGRSAPSAGRRPVAMTARVCYGPAT